MNQTEKGEIKVGAVFISVQALSRAKKDKFIKNNKKKYTAEIAMIIASNGNRPCETIGSFKVSPRGNNPCRVAWFFVIEGSIKTFYIADLLYHINNVRYVDDWPEKVRSREINLLSYGPYVPYEGL